MVSASTVVKQQSIRFPKTVFWRGWVNGNQEFVKEAYSSRSAGVDKAPHAVAGWNFIKRHFFYFVNIFSMKDCGDPKYKGKISP